MNAPVGVPPLGGHAPPLATGAETVMRCTPVVVLHEDGATTVVPTVLHDVVSYVATDGAQVPPDGEPHEQPVHARVSVAVS